MACPTDCICKLLPYCVCKRTACFAAGQLAGQTAGQLIQLVDEQVVGRLHRPADGQHHRKADHKQWAEVTGRPMGRPMGRPIGSRQDRRSVRYEAPGGIQPQQLLVDQVNHREGLVDLPVVNVTLQHLGPGQGCWDCEGRAG